MSLPGDNILSLYRTLYTKPISTSIYFEKVEYNNNEIMQFDF